MRKILLVITVAISFFLAPLLSSAAPEQNVKGLVQVFVFGPGPVKAIVIPLVPEPCHAYQEICLPYLDPDFVIFDLWFCAEGNLLLIKQGKNVWLEFVYPHKTRIDNGLIVRRDPDLFW